MPLRIIIFARTPQAGRVKTRLIGRLTAEQARQLHVAMIADTLALVAAVPAGAAGSADSDVTRQILFSDDVPPMELPPGVTAGGQARGDLGARLAAAIERAFTEGVRKVIILGSDSPHLPAARLAEATGALDAADVVLGPADDGGFYLVGVRIGVPPREIFKDIEWGSARAFDQALAAASAAGLSTATLERFYDLDEWPDLERLAREDRWAPQTRALLARLAG